MGNAGLFGYEHLISGVALEHSPFFRQPRILGIRGVWGWVVDWLGLLCDHHTFQRASPSGLPQGAPRPLDPSAKLARRATASIDMSFYFVS